MPKVTGLLACCALFIAPLALADDTLRWLDQERRDREALERDQRLRQLQQPRPTPPPAEPTVAAEARCWRLSGLRLAGNRLIDDRTLQPLLSQRLRPCMGADALRQVLVDITQAYVQRGYIAARAYPAQTPADGQPLDIVIEEGFVESIELADDSLPVSLASAFPDLVGRPLHLPTLEQGLDQLNRLRSIDLQAQVQPGELDGGSRILLTSRSRRSPWGLRVGYGNGGDTTNGRHGLSLVASRDNPLQLNDVLQASLFGTFGNAPNYTRGLGLYYSVPYGAWTLGASLGHSEQRAFTGHGVRHDYTSDSRGLSLGRSLWRNQHTLLSASLRLNRKTRDYRLNHRSIAQQDASLTSAGLDLNLLWLGRATWSAQLGYAHSLPWLGADTRPFEQWRLGVLRSQAWPGNRHQWRWDSSLEAQYSPTLLPASEQWLLSSPGSVRGLRDSNIAASSALVLRNSLSLALPLAPGLVLTPHVAVDYGRGRGTWHGRGRQQPALAGVSTGASLGWRGGEVKLDYRHAVVIKDGPPSEPGFWNMELKLDF
ncbi:ShlB/FhaC/HecB family hemolysin secretion/activation protein [Pseudomonas sp. App30]|uniref:ShlB/FhaC/HecB family hemolysin secretion/activation protein n=1 Tax=Pseudomonas sp. App30 TaxID=3068990 RepID=UPI003A7F7C2D